jgi:tRNA threonylcarbamoyladenosine biosynthesis protein TsaE
MEEKRIISTNSDKTLQVAERIGRRLEGGEVIELVGDLGSGKTFFVRGLARGTGSRDEVRSPSFTLSNHYRSKSLNLYHFDFYRLSEPGIMRDELAEAQSDSKGVVALEWSNIVEDVLPKERLTITLKATGLDSREITIAYPKQLEYLVKNT